MSAATRTHTRPRTHLVRAVVAAIIAALGVLALQPTGSTQAAWSDAAQVDVPAATTGGISLTVAAPAAGRATVSSNGTVALAWSPTAVTVAADGVALTGNQLAGTRLEYRVSSGTSCSTSGAAAFTAAPAGVGTSFAVNGGTPVNGNRTLCVTLVPSDALRISHGGLSLSVTTTITAESTGSGTWTTGQTWTTTQQMPALPHIDTLGCRTGGTNIRVTLTWDWLDPSGTESTVPVRSWSLQRATSQGWAPVNVGNVGPRSIEISRWNLPVELIADTTHHIRIVATLADGRQVASAGSIPIRTTSFLGLFGTIRCA